jgi:TolB protein
MKRVSVSCVRLLGVIALGLLICLPDAQAQDGAPPPQQGIDIDVKGGAGRQLVSLAIAPIAGDASATKRLSEVIANDLELAGFFTLIPRDALFFDASKEGMEASQIDFGNWFNVKAQGLIKGEIKGQGDKLSVDLRLYIVDRKEQARLDFKARAVSSSEIEALGHEFANAIVHYYTGEKGAFGEQIAFVRRDKAGRKQIFVQRFGDSSAQQITRNDSINILPRWGAGRLFYTSFQDQNPDLWVHEGGKHRKLSSQRGMNSGAAVCGGKMLVTMSKGGENTDIYQIDASTGREIARLTTHWAIDTSPTFSPDCKQVAFLSDRSGSPQIFVMNADGSDQRRLTFKGTYNTSPSWSPKGDKIVFQARDDKGSYDIFLVDLRGNMERLTQNQGNNEDPSFSRDGRYIVFVSSRKGGRHVWVMTSDGTYQRQLTTGAGGHDTPSWFH